MWSNALYVSLESVGVTGTIYLGIVRFNNFKNKYQQDVNFVLVADTASKGLRTFITFMFLGHLASTIGVDVRMLVHMESNFVVEIMPQAMSVVPYHQLWSHVHSLWLLSTMIPKFLIVPDIVIEVLSPVNPFFFLNRTVVHFFVCMSLLLASIIVCTPGGANFAAMIVHNHDQNLRFAVLFLESVVFLQYCGIRRLDIICRMMTGRDYTIFVKICLASVVPVIVVCLFCAELLYAQAKESHHPLWIYGLITWFDLVQLSCVAVFAVVFMGETGMTFENCLLPLPTWLPASWDRGMHYRHMMAGEGIDPAPTPPTPTSTVARPEKVTSRPSTDTSSSSSSTSSSSTEFMGTHLVVASDHRFAIPGNGREPGGRDVSAAAPTSVHTQQQRMADPTAVGATKSMAPSISEGRVSATVEPESGTLHVSRNLSTTPAQRMWYTCYQ
ncbi:sodium- and chloride-dependent GABA transporter ine-like [Haemaphysalis longicornis]